MQKFGLIGCLSLGSGSSFAGGQWKDGDEPLYYIVSPKDVVIARPRWDLTTLSIYPRVSLGWTVILIILFLPQRCR